MPSSSRSNSSVPSRRSNTNKAEQPPKRRKNSSKSRSASPKKNGSPIKRQRKNSSCSRSNKSVKSAQNTVAQNGNGKKRSAANSSVGSRRSRSKSPPAGAKKRSHPNSSRSRSPEVRQKIKKNSSDKSNSSKKSNKSRRSNNNNYSPPRNNFGNRDNNDGQFRGRGRGRGRGGDRGRGRGGFNNNGQRNFNDSREDFNRGGGYNRDNNGFGNRENNFNRNNNFNNNRNGNDGFNNENRRGFNNGDRNNGYGNNNNSFGSNQRSPNNSNSFNSHNSPPHNNRNSSPRSPMKNQEPKKTPQQIRLEEFYNSHKEEGWFKEKYNPISLISQENQRFLYIKKAQEQFLQQLNNGYYNEISLTIADYKALGNLEFEQKQDGQVDEKKMTSIVTLYLNDTVKIEGPPFYGIEKDSSTLYISNVPKEIYRYDIYEVVSEIDGFKNLILNQPLRKMDFKRMAWIQYQSQIKATQALQKLKNVEIKEKKLQFTSSCKRIRKAKTVINYPATRIQEDLKSVIQISAKLDYEAKTYQKNTLYEYKFPNSLKKFEIFLTYLRKVHFFDYFESRFYDSFRTLTIRSGMTILLMESDPQIEIEIQELKKLDIKNSIVKEKGSTEYRKREIDNLNIFTQLIKESLYKIHQFQPDIQDQPKYWKCHECRKKFMTIVHLIKHTTSRHQDLIDSQIEAAMLKIYTKNAEEWEKNKGEREARENREERRKRVRKPLKDFDCPEEEEDQELRLRLRPVSQTKKLINFLDI